MLERPAPHVETLIHLGIGRSQRVEETVPQHPEFQVVEEAVNLVAVPRLHPQGVRRLRQRHVLDEVGELAVQHHARQVGPQRVADLALDRVDVVDQRLQRPVLGDPLCRGLLPHTGDAGQVVAGIAAQRREVGVLLRGQPVLVDDRIRGEPGQLADPFTRVQHGDVIADQLQRVTVTADDQDAVSVVLGLGGQRGNDVVGLETRLGEHGDAERDQHLLGDVDLSAEFVGCGRPACLVLRVLVDAEGLPGDVEGRGDV